MRSNRLSTAAFVCAAAASIANRPVAPLVLLSDLPTPSFVIDTEALRRRVGPRTAGAGDAAPFAPSIRCPKNDLLIRPSPIGRDAPAGGNPAAVDCDFEVIEAEPAVGYLHTSVVRGRKDAVPGAASTYLAEVDLDPGLCRGSCPGGDAQLVLGLNNHHVGGYYWARSAGAGSSMEAPGVRFERGMLTWLKEEGPTACNSNDGKRSEWANFLKKGDTVQLVPADGQGTLSEFVGRFSGRNADGGDAHVYGISTRGRPMGSEPEVVCEWRSG